MSSLDELRTLVRDSHQRLTLAGRIRAVIQDSSDVPTNKVRVFRLDIRRLQIVNGFKYAPGLFCWVELMPDLEYQVVDVDIPSSTQVLGEGVGAATIPPGAHETVPWSIPAQGFVPGRLEASQLGGLYVHVRSFWYDDQFYDGDALDPSTGLPTLNDFTLSTYTPASIGFSQWVPVWFDPSDASIGIDANTAVFGTTAQLLESTIDLSAVPAGCYVLGAVGLANGQTVIDSTSRIADPRFHLAPKGILESALDRILTDSAGNVLSDSVGNILYSS